MRKRHVLGLTGMALLAICEPSLACVAPPPWIDPKVQKSDVVLVGTVTNRVHAGEESGDANVAIARVAKGAYASKSYTIDHFLFDGSGMCAVGPDIDKGDKVAIYLEKRGGRIALQGFLPLAYAITVDRRLRQSDMR